MDRSNQWEQFASYMIDNEEVWGDDLYVDSVEVQSIINGMIDYAEEY